MFAYFKGADSSAKQQIIFCICILMIFQFTNKDLNLFRKKWEKVKTINIVIIK